MHLNMIFEKNFLEITIIHHVGLIFMLLWLLSCFNLCNAAAYFVSLFYIYTVHERYVMRLRKKLEYEERRQSYRKRVLSESESVRWLNHVVEKIWPICMEQFFSQRILLPIIPWFLEKYKPWTAKEAVIQHLYLGRNAPLFTGMKALWQCTDDDHLVLELGMNFLTADDMCGVLAVKLRKRLGFGMWAKLHITAMHLEAKVLIGVKFLRQYPFLGRLRLCFVEPPYFHMTVKPIFHLGLDVTEVPGIAGWLDKLLSIAFEQTLVEPNMLVVDFEKFVTPHAENWFSVHERQPHAHAKIEVIEATELKPSDANGLADPYVKGRIALYGFKTKTLKKTLSPKWCEEFMIPISSWDTPNVLAIEVLDKDHFVDDFLGKSTVNVCDLRGGARHDIWLPLENTKTGRLHLAITVLEDDTKGYNDDVDDEKLSEEDTQKGSDKDPSSPVSSKKYQNLPDHFEPINIEGQEEPAIWVHHPGCEVSQTWEPRKGKARRIETQIHGVANDSFSGNLDPPHISDSSTPHDGNRVKRSLQRISSAFSRSRNERYSGSRVHVVQSSDAHDEKEVVVKFVPDDSLRGGSTGKVQNEGRSSPTGSSPEHHTTMKDRAKSFLKHAEDSARRMKRVISVKGRKSPESKESSMVGQEYFTTHESDNSSADEPLLSTGAKSLPAVSNPVSTSSGTADTNELAVVSDSRPRVDRATNDDHDGVSRTKKLVNAVNKSSKEKFLKHTWSVKTRLRRHSSVGEIKFA